jgi:protein-tyrosine-phosphatase
MNNGPATSTMQRAAAELGIDLSNHRSTALRDCDQPDLIFGMEQQHLVAASRRFPDLAATQIKLLDHPRAIEDPYGLELDAYRKTVATIMRALESIYPRGQIR